MGARLELRRLSKMFGRLRALDAVDLTVSAGEIHGLVGQNGSGKSTVVKILAGYHAPERGGEIRLNGTPLRVPVHPTELRAAGVSIVHQDLGLVPHLSVAENVCVGGFRRSRWLRRIDWAAEAATARGLLSRLEADIDPEAVVGDLGPADRSLVAIARALHGQRPGDGVIVLDESTRALPRNALADFYRIVRKVVDEGGSALLISHNLEEVMAVTDRVTVLRDGVVAAPALVTARTSEQEIARAMLGHDVRRYTGTRSRWEPREAIEVRGLRGAAVTDLSFEVHRGEVLGLTGLAGSGWEEIPYLLSGALPATAGSVTIGGRRLGLSRTPVKTCVRHGIALVPEHRATDGLAMGLTLQENATLPRAGSRGRPWFIGTGWQREETTTLIRTLGVSPKEPDRPVGQLSGGNQQKVLIGKWLLGSPTLLVLHEPAQAVDIAAREDILAAIRAAADRGCAVILASIQPADLAAVCDRILVVRSGAIGDDITGATEDAIVEAVYAGRPIEHTTGDTP